MAEFTSWNLAADNVPAAVSLAGHIALRCDTVRHDEERAPATMKSEQTVVQAARALQGGALVAFPTETVYGLGADATNPAAVARIYAAKGRPSSHPLIVHLASAEDLSHWAVDPPAEALLLAATFWPGPLTIVVGSPRGLAAAVTGGRATVGLRVPDHPMALELIRLAGVPIAAPSANRFGRVSPTTAAHVRAELGNAVDVVLDGGPCRVGVESTIIEILPGGTVLLRPGGVTVDAIEAVLGRAIERIAPGPARASGMLPSHYAPAAEVEMLDAGALKARAAEHTSIGRRVGVLALTVEPPRGTLSLGHPRSVEELAHGLYGHLRAADEAGVDVVLIEAPAADGLGLAILDRVGKAAAPRPSAE